MYIAMIMIAFYIDLSNDFSPNHALPCFRCDEDAVQHEYREEIHSPCAEI